MPSFTIFEKPDLPLEESAENAVIVKNGFSYWAFFLPLPWLLVKRLWWVLLGYIAIIVVFSTLDSLLPFWASLLLSLVFAFLFATEAPNLVGWSLERKGYREVVTLFAEDREHCEERYVKARVEMAETAEDRKIGANLAARSATSPNLMSHNNDTETKRVEHHALKPISGSQDQPVLGLFPAPKKD